MSTFLPNIPTANQQLDFSQGQLLTNNQALDAIFGIDHYKFSNVTANQGFHNQVTTPGFVATPPTGLPPVTTTNPILYGFQQTAPLGLLQYSRGPSNAIPTPITFIQSTSAGINLANNATTLVLDFTGIPQAIFNFYAVSMNFPVGSNFNTSTAYWNGAAFSLGTQTNENLALIASGNQLLLKNISGGPAVNNIFWTLQFLRLQ